MAESKSTDKLRIINDIVASTLRELSQDKRDKLTRIEVSWENLGIIEVMPVPSLKIEFKE